MRMRFFFIAFFLSILSLSANATMLQNSIKSRETKGSYYVYEPPGLTAGMPLLIVLTDGDNNPQVFAQYNRVYDAANRGGFAVAFPAPDLDTWQYNHYGQIQKNTDTVFINKMIDRIIKIQKIDERRIFIAGYADGGFMAQNYACLGSYKLRGIAVVAAAMPRDLQPFCDQTSLSVLYIRGAKDAVIHADEGWKGKFTYLSTANSLNFWATKNGCKTYHTTRFKSPDNAVTEEGNLTNYDQCLNQTSVSFYELLESGHGWPGSTKSYGPDGIRSTRLLDAASIIEKMVLQNE